MLLASRCSAGLLNADDFCRRRILSDAADSVCTGCGANFGSVVALDDVSFDIRPGETHAIMGENGAGKSTLMKILAGVQRPTSGELLVRGRPVSFAGTREAEATGISMIHQELNLVEQLSVSANIFLGRELTNGWGVLQQGEMDRRAAALLEQLETPISPRALVGSLRVGDQQLVEIARASFAGVGHSDYG